MSREEFLHRVRAAVAEGNRAGGAAVRPERGGVGYQGAGDDPVARLRAELTAAGGRLHEARDAGEALRLVRRVVAEKDARRVLVGDGELLDSMDLETALAGIEVVRVRALEAVGERAAFFAADVGVSGVDHVIAETGTLVLATRRDQPRSLSLLPPVHVAVVRRDQLLGDLFDLFGDSPLPSCLSLITGPSKTGDIELKLVTGVHGPGEVHLVLITG
ncbi:MAG: lactate utilization protein [Gemmataceae bacterium]